MSFAVGSLQSSRSRHSVGVALRAAARSPRFWVYLMSSLIALAISDVLGKDVMWDTLAYHLYAGFGALHDRFGQDYFAAGAQSYFNPYVYVPYYLLTRSGLSAFGVSAVLALVQSGILWLTYELAISVSPVEGRSARTAFACCSVALAFANPILINLIGTSYVDTITGEVVLAAWLLLLAAVRAPGMLRVIGAGLLLGAVSALKLTNAVHTLAACSLLLFVPGGYKARARHALAFAAAVTSSFLVVMAPWSIHLERHFGNPFFPLFNGLFRSPQFFAASLQDHRFIPDSLANALLRPFAIAAPVTLTDDEFAAPDLRYAILLVLTASVLVGWAWRRYARRGRSQPALPASSQWHAFVALGCGFLTDWVLWLAASGIGRYFIPMACVAAVLAMGLLFRLCAARPSLRAYLIVALLGVQAFELCAGATYRVHIPWDGGPPFELSIPNALAEQPGLYLTQNEVSLSFLAPFLAPASGLVNLEGDFVIGPNGPNGAHLKSLIGRYAPHVRVVVFDRRVGAKRGVGLPDAEHVNDTLAHFGLRAISDDCATIVMKDARPSFAEVPASSLPIHLPQLNGRMIRVPMSPNDVLMACKVVPDNSQHTALFGGDRRADLVFNRLEDACPQLFQPSRTVTEDFGDDASGYRMRRYEGTGLALMITRGSVKFFDPLRGGSPTYLGRESDWETASLPLVCGRRDERYYAEFVKPRQPRGIE